MLSNSCTLSTPLYGAYIRISGVAGKDSACDWSGSTSKKTGSGRTMVFWDPYWYAFGLVSFVFVRLMSSCSVVGCVGMGVRLALKR